ncbi:MAG: hypothetical protein FJ184_07070 [Gammaproteobacteria bacterium]|nr:hypothetical protein [Gammaproteobacteria bacterium]
MRLVSALVSTTVLIGVIVPRVGAAESTTAQLTPFVMLDVATEKDSVSPIKNEYFNKHITTGFKTAGKWEYSLKLGTSDKDARTYKLVSNVIEGKIKKSVEVRKGIYPYVSARFAEKTYSSKTKPYTSSFTYYSFDVGSKFSLSDSIGLDIGFRFRDSDKYSYESERYHAMLLFDVNEFNTIGIRYSESSSDNLEEDRQSVRLHWQHNFR